MNNKKHIVMLLDSTFPPDIRVEKEISTLSSQGYDISILCRMEKGKPTKEYWKNVTICRWVSITPKWLKALNAFIANVLFINILFLNAIKKIAKEHPIDIIHVHDLPLINTALRLRKKYKYKVIFDCHENYPEGLREWNKWNAFSLKNSIKTVLFNYKRWLKHEKKALHHCDATIVVVKEMKKRMMTLHKVPEKNLHIVSNTEAKSFKDRQIDPTILNSYKNDFIVSYIGGFGPHRGIDTAIQAMSYIDQPEIKFLLIGGGPIEVENKIISLINKLSLESRIIKLSWQPFDTVPSYIATSKICLVPHHNNPHTSNTIPHKLFQYMSFGKPIIASDCESLCSVINDTNSGLIFEAGKPKDLANKIMLLYKEKERYDLLSQNGVNATINGHYNWETESKNLLSLYQNLS